jgi:hypothetical protein
VYKVDYDMLGQLGTELGQLRDEFNGVEDDISGYEGQIGSGEVADKLNSFASNWSHKRHDIASNLDGVAAAATQAAEGYKQADGDIAGAFTE